MISKEGETFQCVHSCIYRFFQEGLKTINHFQSFIDKLVTQLETIKRTQNQERPFLLIYCIVRQECTRWNVSPSLLIIDIMLIVLSIKHYYNCHINKIVKQRPMNHENEVKVRWTMPGRHVQLTMLPYNNKVDLLLIVLKK